MFISHNIFQLRQEELQERGGLRRPGHGEQQVLQHYDGGGEECQDRAEGGLGGYEERGGGEEEETTEIVDSLGLHLASL